MTGALTSIFLQSPSSVTNCVHNQRRHHPLTPNSPLMHSGQNGCQVVMMTTMRPTMTAHRCLIFRRRRRIRCHPRTSNVSMHSIQTPPRLNCVPRSLASRLSLTKTAAEQVVNHQNGTSNDAANNFPSIARPHGCL